MSSSSTDDDRQADLSDDSWPRERTVSCPPIPTLREAMLREDWSGARRPHVDQCPFCQRHLKQIAAHVWHPDFSALCRDWRTELSPAQRSELEFHLAVDRCRGCLELESLWRENAELQSLAQRAHQVGTLDAWAQFAEAAMAARPQSGLLRQRLHDVWDESRRSALSALAPLAAAPTIPSARPSLLQHVQGLVARLLAGEEFARESLVALAWSRIASLLARIHGEQASQIPEPIVQGAAERIRRALAIPPSSAREFFRVAAEQIRQELLSLGDSGGFAGAETKAALADATTTEDQSPARWREICLALERGALGDEEQEVVELLWLHGLPADQAAELVGAEARTVRRAFRGALLRLHEGLENRPG